MYLHEQCDPKIIHRDVKAANILLDDYCEAVVGDFGLAKLLDHQDSHVTTAVRGTVGHIAPEYLSTGQSSEKTDVFGFGILLLELITGQRALEFGKAANKKGAMLDWVSTIFSTTGLLSLNFSPFATFCSICVITKYDCRSRKFTKRKSSRCLLTKILKTTMIELSSRRWFRWLFFALSSSQGIGLRCLK